MNTKTKYPPKKRFSFSFKFIALIFLFACQHVVAQNGFIYVHLQSINEENGPDFPFVLKNSLGVTVSSFKLNDQATSDNVALSNNYIHAYDIGLGHGIGGDGQLWAIGGTSFNTAGSQGNVYFRNPGSSQWQQPATAINNAIYIDGAYANQFVYIDNNNNVWFYNSGTTTKIYTGGDAWDVTANGGRIAISTATQIKLYSNTYVIAVGVLAGGTWTALATPNKKCRLDMNLGGNTIVYEPAGSNTVSTVTTAGVVTSLGTVGIGSASVTDVAYDDNGNIYTDANNATYTDLIYHWVSGTTWVAETQSRSLSTLTGGVGSLMYAVNYGVPVATIYSRQTDNAGNIYWIDDERIKKTSTLNGNGIIISVPPGVYTLTETLPNLVYDDLSRYNIYDPNGLTTGNVSTQVVTYTITAGKVAFAEYVNEKLKPYTVNITACNTSYWLQSFDADNSSPIHISPTYGTSSFGAPYLGTGYHYYSASSPQDGYYYLVKNENNGNWFGNTAILSDHTGNNGYFLLVNASYSKDEFFRQRLTNLTTGLSYKISYWAANVNPSPPALIFPNVTLGAQDTTGAILSSASSGNVPSPANPANGTNATWYQYSLTFTATSTTVDIFLRNNNPGGYGNDVAIDDITIQLLPPAPTVSGIANCTASGTINVSSPIGANLKYSDNGGSTYQSSPTFSSLAPGTYSVVANYTTATGCASTPIPVTIISPSSIWAMDGKGYLYPMSLSGTVSSSVNSSNGAPLQTGNANGVGYNPTNGLYYYFLNNSSGSQAFYSYTPSLSSASAYTLLASPPAGAGSIYIGGTTSDGNGYYAIDNKGYLYYYDIGANTWTTITTSIVDNYGNNLTSIIAGSEWNGDLTEDISGNMALLISSTTQYGLYRILGPIPTTAQPSITARQVIKYNTALPSSNGGWVGMSFDSPGNLYLASNSQLWEIQIGSTTPSQITLTNPGAVQFSDLSQCAFPLTLLPNVWSYFKVAPNNNEVNIKWGIEQSIEAKGFYVERSSNSIDWDTLTFVPYIIADNSLDFSVVDPSPKPGVNYYRIHQVMYNGSGNYSETKTVNISLPSSNILVWPNPFHTDLYLEYNGNTTNAAVQIFDQFGRSIIKSDIKPGKNFIKAMNLPKGIYYLQITEGNNVVSYKKVLKI